MQDLQYALKIKTGFTLTLLAFNPLAMKLNAHSDLQKSEI